MTLFREALAVRTHKCVAWRLAGEQVHGGNERLTNKTLTQVAALTPSPSKRLDTFLDT
jgi:hypothetical protein